MASFWTRSQTHNRNELEVLSKVKIYEVNCEQKDDEKLSTLGVNTGAMLYFKDRGLQIGWITVFLCEYAGYLH